MYIERTITLYDDDELNVRVSADSLKETDIALKFPDLDCSVYCSRKKVFDILRDIARQIRACRPKNPTKKEGICGVKSFMTDEEIAKELGWTE